MKPTLPVIVFCTALVCAAHPAAAQSSTGSLTMGREPWPAPATEWNTATQLPWAVAPPEPPLPYSYFWQDYRGSAIEHHLYDAAPHVCIRRPRPVRGLVDAICGLFEKITSPLCHSWCCWSSAKGCCNYAVSAPQINAPPRSVSEFGPVPIPADVGLPPLPIPALPPIPAPRSTASQNSTTPATPLAAPSPLPLNPAIEDSALPLPVTAEPYRSESSSIVELAPDFVLPPEPSTPAAPRNRIPSLPVAPPRNVIPTN